MNKQELKSRLEEGLYDKFMGDTTNKDTLKDMEKVVYDIIKEEKLLNIDVQCDEKNNPLSLRNERKLRISLIPKNYISERFLMGLKSLEISTKSVDFEDITL